MNLLSKLNFLLKKPRVVVVTGNGRACAKEAIFQVLDPHFRIGKDYNSPTALPQKGRTPILIFGSGDKEIGKFEFFLKNSQKAVLVITHVGDIPHDKDFFSGEKEKVKEATHLAKTLPAQTNLILNFDDETVREINDITNLKTLTFGFNERADLRASDVMLNMGTNFKVNYKGNIVPVWLEKLFGKEQIYASLVAAAVGTIFDLNLVEISQSLKNYFSLPGKMILIEGIRKSFILDDSESATVFSMVEAIETLGKIEWARRKIAVLGDVIGIGKYTIEAHEAIGEKVAKNCDLLFTVGPRAKFIAQGAIQKGMPLEKIFSFDKIEEGKLKLKKEIKEGDLILVDGSKEMEMGKIVKEIAAFV